MSSLTEDEKLKIKELLESERVDIIIRTMCISYSLKSTEKMDNLLHLIPNITGAQLKVRNKEIFLKQKAVETLEYMIPRDTLYPFGNLGVITYVYCQSNFKKMYEDSINKHYHMLTAKESMQGRPGCKATIPLFIKYIDSCMNNEYWEDDLMWKQLDSIDCKEMVRWCINNRDKWDDYTKSNIEKQLNLDANGII